MCGNTCSSLFITCKRLQSDPKELEVLMLDIMMLISEIRQSIKEEQMDQVIKELKECIDCYFQPKNELKV